MITAGVMISFLQIVFANPSHAGRPAASTPGLRKYWVYFVDKGAVSPGRSLRADDAPELTERALRRRTKTLGPANVVLPEDLPLNARYVGLIETLGARVVVKSRWMNALSAWMSPDRAREIEGLSCVLKISPVRVLRVRAGPDGATVPETRGTADNGAPEGGGPPDADGPPIAGGSPIVGNQTVPDYGTSFAQLDAVRVPQLHAIGVTGRDVLVGLLDSGFRWRDHRSLTGMQVTGEHDFLSDDDNTANEPGDNPGQDSHGTLVLSVLGGYAPGSLIGTAFGSEYLLAKTEVIGSETQIEEDYWAAGIEWLESRGADVVNSSLGYDVWDDGSGYSWAGGDFDGKTSVVARAGAQAARLGVVLCVAAGNEGNGDGVTGTLLTPADVDTAITAGAASFDGLLSGSSSTGPTSDGRIKPDLTAPGQGVYSASVSGYDSYAFQSGTSLASPFAAGAAALLLSVRPGLTPVEVRDILRSAADSARIRNFVGFPNNFTGWGYLDALGAALSVGPVFSNRPLIDTSGGTTRVAIDIVSKYGLRSGEVLLFSRREDDATSAGVYRMDPMTLDSSFMFPGSGRYTATLTGYPVGTGVAFTIGAGDSAGNSYRSPPEAVADRWVFTVGSTAVGGPPDLPTAFRLLQNYPNPFNGTTSITYDLPEDGPVSVKVYNVLGQLVATLFDGFQSAGPAGSRSPLMFGADDVPGGAYFCRVVTPLGSDVIKMMVLK